MKLFTRPRKNKEAYPKAHILRTINPYEVVALCWHALSPEKIVWVGNEYRGKVCGACSRAAKNTGDTR